MRSPRSNLRLRRYPLRKDHFEAILGIGLISMLSAIITTLSVMALTAAAGVSGIAAIAGYGIASRLDMLLIGDVRFRHRSDHCGRYQPGGRQRCPGAQGSPGQRLVRCRAGGSAGAGGGDGAYAVAGYFYR